MRCMRCRRRHRVGPRGSACAHAHRDPPDHLTRLAAADGSIVPLDARCALGGAGRRRRRAIGSATRPCSLAGRPASASRARRRSWRAASASRCSSSTRAPRARRRGKRAGAARSARRADKPRAPWRRCGRDGDSRNRAADAVVAGGRRLRRQVGGAVVHLARMACSSGDSGCSGG